MSISSPFPPAGRSRPPWWPPTKVAGKHLGPALAGAGVGPVAPEPYGLAVGVQIDLDDPPGLTGTTAR